MIRSIRFSLTIWYVGILTIILSLFGYTLYSNVSANLYRDKMALLISEADGIGDAIFSFWKAEWETQDEGLFKKNGRSRPIANSAISSVPRGFPA